jgi:enediyne biosynthesis protein E5
MGWNSGTSQPNEPAFWRDPRLYQIASLFTLLLYGLLFLHFEVSIWQIAITLGVAQLTQYVCTRYCNLPSFDPKSALISSLSLCLLLRSNNLTVVALAAFIAIGSKFVIRWNDKHIFNPTNLALVVVLVTGLGWISPGQWGQVAWLGFLIACLGSLVVTRAARADVTLAFLTFYIGLLFIRALWLGDPFTIPLHQIESGALLIFAFFMISDPNQTPRPRRILEQAESSMPCSSHLPHCTFNLGSSNQMDRCGDSSRVRHSFPCSIVCSPVLDMIGPSPRPVTLLCPYPCPCRFNHKGGVHESCTGSPSHVRPQPTALEW